MAHPKDFLSKEQQQQVLEAIKKAELKTSGEIRLHIESTCKKDVLDRASEVFAQLNMHKTKLRNGVLFYLSTNDKKFAILGDAGINSKVESNFWEKEKELVLSYFKQGDFSKGLVKGILLAGEKLKQEFPYQSDDINELPDDISFGNDKSK